MQNLPQQNTQAERDYFNEPEKSRAYEAAEETVASVKQSIKDLAWISGAMLERNSLAVSLRWDVLKQLFTHIRKYGDAYSPLMMKGIEKELASEMKEADEANVDFQSNENPGEYFYYYLTQYGYAITEAFKKEMTDEERVIYETNYA